jgi:hypothetical protein
MLILYAYSLCFILYAYSLYAHSGPLLALKIKGACLLFDGDFFPFPNDFNVETLFSQRFSVNLRVVELKFKVGIESIFPVVLSQ